MPTADGCVGSGAGPIVSTWVSGSYVKSVVSPVATVNGMFGPLGTPPTP
jgi:hypothetical protein